MPNNKENRPAANNIDEKFDVIVIGSGIGGLSCASLLTQLGGKRVLVLEQHYRLGGFTHNFTRRAKGDWDVGLHYVGQMDKGESIRGLMDLITGGKVDWQKMPSPFERYIYPDLTISQPVGRKAYIEQLSEHWPEERQGIIRYFDRVRSAARWLAPYLMSSGGPLWLRWPASAFKHIGRRQALQTTKTVLDELIKCPRLKAVLASQWGDYGLPPAQSAFVVHATIVSHYLDGGWVPKGGAKGIAEAVRSIVEKANGACLTMAKVEQVLIENGRAIGVRASCGPGERAVRQDFRAPLIISDTGAHISYEKLLSDEDNPKVSQCRKALRQLPAGYSPVQLFLGLKDSPRTLGFTGENHWYFASYDHDTLFERRQDLLDGQVMTAYLSFPSLKDPTAETHTVEIIAPFDYSAVAPWAASRWQRRGPDYQALKENISNTLLKFAESKYPGFNKLIDYKELATPLSFEHFAAHSQGAIYGLPAVPERYTAKWLRIKTPVPGLLLTGSDVCSHGIAGAMLGGVGTSADALGGSAFLKIMASAGQSK